MSAFQLSSVITAHSWSPDRMRLAVCENEPDVVIYSNCQAGDVSSWKKEHILRQHTMVVTGIDWHPQTNKLVTCSHDVNAFVWTYDSSSNRWEPKLSILRINRAALGVKWSPDGSKFAVASGSKVVPVCYYERNQDWWVSKMLKKHRSTVLAVAWHPSSQLVASAACDFKCRVFSAFVAASDKKGVNTVFGNMESLEFGQLVTELESGIGGANNSNGGWIEAVAWNPSGTGLCFAAHDSTLSFVHFTQGAPPVCVTIRTTVLPFTSLLYLSDAVLVGAGHDFEPFVFQKEGKTEWGFLGSIDGKSSGAQAQNQQEQQSPKKKGGFMSSVKMWEKKITQGVVAGSGSDSLTTLHHNTITDIASYGSDGFSTCGNDGRVVIWNKAAINAVNGLSL